VTTTQYVTRTQSNGKLKRGPMVSVPERNYSEPVPDEIVARVDDALLVLDDNDHAYTLYFDGRPVAVVWGPSADGDDSWFYRAGGKPEGRKVVGRDHALNAALLPSLARRHEYDELLFGGFMCLTCSPKEGQEGYGEVETTVSWPCPPLLAAGMTGEQALDHIEARRAEIEAAAKAKAQKPCDEFNAKYPVGTPVRYWKGARTGTALEGETIEPARVMGDMYVPVVRVEDLFSGRGFIALTHVEPIEGAGADA
jgi:hypothetical protein